MRMEAEFNRSIDLGNGNLLSVRERVMNVMSEVSERWAMTVPEMSEAKKGCLPGNERTPRDAQVRFGELIGPWSRGIGRPQWWHCRQMKKQNYPRFHMYPPSHIPIALPAGVSDFCQFSLDWRKISEKYKDKYLNFQHVVWTALFHCAIEINVCWISGCIHPFRWPVGSLAIVINCSTMIVIT